ncbi:MAG: glycogen/starch/alpha-glucan phosphorylase [Thermodesulfovibrionales bacterium]|nr:glycogen/starch/alpha-glucan phosphorylase [Thermodesulfovibrionales bacterium]
MPKEYRTGLTVEAIRQSVLDNLYFHLGKIPDTATQHDWYMALAYTVRDRLMQRWIKTVQNYTEDLTVVAYLSDEFLMGPQLGMHLINLGISNEISQALQGLGLNVQELAGQEGEPGLGNSGLGMLAACSMDSLATLEIPAIGYGIRYEFGAFHQEIRDGWQVEMTDKWLRHGNPWEVQRHEIAYTVNIGGHTESYYDEQDCFRVRWIPKFALKGTAYDIPVSGYRVATTNLLRLWKSEAVETFDYEAFNIGDYFGAVNEKIASESISKILYPDDEPYIGKQLRLAQQYFFVSCALQDMIRLHLLRWKNINAFSSSFAVQLNDTHPAIAVAELMRLLVDEHLVNWDKAWYITQNAFSYTNHATLTEALEKWPLSIFANILPRHLEIIYEINRRFLDEIWLKYPDNNEKSSSISLIDESDQKYVRMAHLGSLGSHAVNGVSEIHSELLKKTVFPDLYELYPERFLNITSGVTQRRWMALSNPGLAELITNTIGEGWISNLEGIKQLEAFANEPNLRKKWLQIKHENKSELTEILHARTGVSIRPDTLFDIQMKRFHESRRQHLNALHIITLYNRIKRNPQTDITPRTFIFGGKASPGYFIANLILKLINSIAEVVNNDPDVAGRLNVVFFPDLNVKNGQKIYPAADLSEQISTAGRESAGTGGIKFSMNGALTIGTSNGTNREIHEEVGAENMFLFGLSAEEISAMKSEGYNPMAYYNENPDLKAAVDLISSGYFSKKDTDLFKPLVDSLLCRDEQMVLADYQSYIDCQDRISIAFRDKEKWAGMSILNVARMGKFSSDRSIREYNEKIWNAAPLKIELEDK